MGKWSSPFPLPTSDPRRSRLLPEPWPPMPALRTRLRALRASSHARSVGGTAFALLVCQALMALAGVLAARQLGPAGKGIVAGVTAWPMMLAYLSLLGINSSATVRIAQKRREGLATTLGSAVAYSLVAGGLVSIVAIAAIPSALGHLGSEASSLAIWALATIPLIMLGDILVSVNVALGRVQLANWCRLGPPIMILGGTVALILAHAVTPGRIVAVNILACVPALVIAAVDLPWRRIALKVPELLSDLKFGVKAHLTTVLGIANLRLDVLLMSGVVSASQLGYYSIANNMMIPVLFGAQAAVVILTPRVASMGRADDRGGIEHAQLATIRAEVRRFGLLGVAGAVFVAVVAPFAVPVVFGKSFEPVVVLVWVLLPGFVARNYSALITAGALGGRRPWVGNAVEGAGVLITVTLLPLLLPRYHALGAAITSTIAYSVSALVASLAIRHIARRAVSGSMSPTGESELGSTQPLRAHAASGRDMTVTPNAELAPEA